MGVFPFQKWFQLEPLWLLQEPLNVYFTEPKFYSDKKEETLCKNPTTVGLGSYEYYAIHVLQLSGEYRHSTVTQLLRKLL